MKEKGRQSKRLVSDSRTQKVGKDSPNAASTETAMRIFDKSVFVPSSRGKGKKEGNNESRPNNRSRESPAVKEAHFNEAHGCASHKLNRSRNKKDAEVLGAVFIVLTRGPL